MSKLHFGLGFFFGCIVGGTCGYFSCKAATSKQLTEDKEGLKQYYKEKYEKAIKEFEKVKEVEAIEQKEEELKAYDELIKNTDYSSFTSYNTVMNPPAEEDFEDVGEEEIPFVKSSSPEKSVDPYLLSGQDEFDNSHRDYFKEDYTYYPNEGLLTDRRDRPVDPESVGGAEMLKIFDDGKTSEIFVRNDMLQMDFDIIVDRTEFR